MRRGRWPGDLRKQGRWSQSLLAVPTGQLSSFCPQALPRPLPALSPRLSTHFSRENSPGSEKKGLWKKFKSCNDEVAAPSPAGPARSRWPVHCVLRALNPFDSPAAHTTAESPAASCLGTVTQRQCPRTRSPGAREGKGGPSCGERPAGFLILQSEPSGTKHHLGTS